ncbi:RNA-directed DNA polymerase from mobile element jockey-like [Brachionus plicatilis]|uniref:RNA-directed DNA polymerase from mobile element jockey-like n=1 Tax=Brachionus plicatilis TaxID=10195 RepID=A0A3M7Q2Q0_BRAPC|nr:RNA-directed DNA polymerase from mobile element jockey-like [Brachionus plicatilis]
MHSSQIGSRELYSMVSDQNRRVFQSNINAILTWTKDWTMNLNLIIHLDNKKFHQDQFYSFEIDDHVFILENTNSEIDLGDNQISKINHKSIFVLGKLRNSFKTWDTRTFMILFTSYVRPILEIGYVAWCSHRKHDIKRIEKVQQRATNDLILVFLRKYTRLVKSCSNRHHFFTNRVIPYWNELPIENTLEPHLSTEIIIINSTSDITKHDKLQYCYDKLFLRGLMNDKTSILLNSLLNNC